MKLAATTCQYGNTELSGSQLTNRLQTVCFRPVSYTVTLLSGTPVLPVFRFRNVERIRRPVGGCKCQKHVAVLSRLGRRSWRLVWHDFLEIRELDFGARLIGRFGESQTRCNEMTELGPLWVVSRRRIGVGHRDDVSHVRAAERRRRIGCVTQGNVRLVLKPLHFQRIPEGCIVAR